MRSAPKRRSAPAPWRRLNTTPRGSCTGPSPRGRVRTGGLAAWRAAAGGLVRLHQVPSKVFGARALHERRTPQIAPHDVMRRIDTRDEMVSVDSRTFEEYHHGCIPGAISVPGGEL